MQSGSNPRALNLERFCNMMRFYPAPVYYQDAKEAKVDAMARAPMCIGWRTGQGFFLYKAQDGCPLGSVPAYFIPTHGSLCFSLDPDCPAI